MDPLRKQQPLFLWIPRPCGAKASAPKRKYAICVIREAGHIRNNGRSVTKTDQLVDAPPTIALLGCLVAPQARRRKERSCERDDTRVRGDGLRRATLQAGGREQGACDPHKVRRSVRRQAGSQRGGKETRRYIGKDIETGYYLVLRKGYNQVQDISCKG